VSPARLRRQLACAAATEALAGRFAAARPADGELAVLFLSGELGTGKTTFARGFLAALGVTEPVRSPTYTLLELYSLGALTAVHADLYRLRGAAELELLGLRDLARPGHLWLVEWPERGHRALPHPDLRLVLSVAEGTHAIDIEAGSSRGKEWLAAVATRSADTPAP
jgi:tRNA threonylcarbamoyladenosine biosynthesis protein TsaE